jgi:hypothetical protein
MNKVYILTREINEYNQEGEYFEAAFSEKPHHSQLTEQGVPKHRLKHVLNGGGRVGYESEWFMLREYDMHGFTVCPKVLCPDCKSETRVVRDEDRLFKVCGECRWSNRKEME